MTDSERQTVLVIDDHPLFRKGVRQLIEIGGDFVLAGEAADGAAGLALAKQLNPDLILLDINMKGMNGIETLRAIKAADLEGRVIMLTVSDHEEDLVGALRAGADGYLLKDMEPEQLLASLKAAAQGQMALSERLVGTLAYALRAESRPTDPEKAGLTDREREILRLIAEGMSNKVIARKLDISEGTVKVHVKNLLKKLNLRSRVEAAVWAVNKSQKPG
jgi:two-component system nitrate/nitrite response regulator NarL